MNRRVDCPHVFGEERAATPRVSSMLSASRARPQALSWQCGLKRVAPKGACQRARPVLWEQNHHLGKFAI